MGSDFLASASRPESKDGVRVEFALLWKPGKSCNATKQQFNYPMVQRGKRGQKSEVIQTGHVHWQRAGSAPPVVHHWGAPRPDQTATAAEVFVEKKHQINLITLLPLANTRYLDTI